MSEIVNWSLMEAQQAMQGQPLTPPDVLTTQKLLEVCGFQDAEAYSAAIRGLVTMIIMFVWMGRIRERWLKNQKLAKVVPLVDKALMVFVAMQFVSIIVSLLRAG